MDMQKLPEFQKLGIKNTQIQEAFSQDDAFTLARVTAVDRGLCTAVSPQDTGPATNAAPAKKASGWPPGFWELRARPATCDPVLVGDWVLLKRAGSDWVVSYVLERSSLLSRGASGESSDSQGIASNIDTVFIVVAAAPTAKLLKRSLNPRRIERYLIAARQAGAHPVVVVNKRDLSGEDEIQKALGCDLQGVDIVLLSATQQDATATLSPWLCPGETAVLVGASGVGKSTLTNCILGRDEMQTQKTRGADTKGRHTTTRRTLHLTGSGALLVDTPGMREFGMTSAEGILELGESCRFSDCSHQNEPGCALLEAVRAGQLSEDFMRDQLALQKEALRQEARRDSYSRHLLHKNEKRFAGVIRETMKLKKRW